MADLQNKIVTTVTRLVHWDSGEWLQHTLDLPGELALGKEGSAKFNHQTIGGSTTYAQKYAYKAILGVPDSEELVDMAEGEKVDLQARSKLNKRQQQSIDDRAAQASTPSYNEKQAQQVAQHQPEPAKTPTGVRSEFFTKAKEYGWGLGDMKKYLIKLFGDAATAKLTEKQLQDTLEAFSQVKPEEFFAEPAPEEAPAA